MFDIEIKSLPIEWKTNFLLKKYTDCLLNECVFKAKEYDCVSSAFDIFCVVTRFKSAIKITNTITMPNYTIMDTYAFIRLCACILYSQAAKIIVFVILIDEWYNHAPCFLYLHAISIDGNNRWHIIVYTLLHSISFIFVLKHW